MRRPGFSASLVLIAMFVLTLPAPSWAQGSLEVAGGYSFLGDSDLVDGFGLG